MLKRIEAYIRENNMIAPGDMVAIGLSGGADSVCLFDILNKLSEKLDFALIAVHVNHLIRDEAADADELFVRNLCRQYDIRLDVVKSDVTQIAGITGETVEEAGRRIRYEAFYKTGATRIAVAHHANDQAETVLYQITRGSSIRGAGGMRPVRDRIIRPLLIATRDEIEEYLKANNLTYCTDETNFDNHYTRNKLRNVVIPYLKENINRDAVGNINDFAEDMQECSDFMEDYAGKIYKNTIRSAGGEIEIFLDDLRNENRIIRRIIIKNAIKEAAGSIKDITRKHICAVDELILSDVSKGVDLPYGLRADRSYEKIVIKKKDKKTDRKELTDNNEGLYYGTEEIFKACRDDISMEVCDYDGQWKKITNDYTKVFDYDKIKGTVILRKRQCGDYIFIDGNGRRKSLKSYLIDEKIPAAIRGDIWMLAVDGSILWVAGRRTSEAYHVDDDTRRILKISVRRNDHGIQDRASD